MADPRLREIYFAAGRLFNVRQYRNTKVSEIAAAAGVATGTIYNLFESKKAILTFVIRASFEEGYLSGDPSLPIAQENESRLLSLFRQSMERYVARVVDREGNAICGFAGLISMLFDMHAETLLATGNIEHNADILPELAEEFFAFRRNGFDIIERLLRQYMQSGEIRMLEYPRVHVQSIADILTWWAMNAYIAMPEIAIPRETGKAIALDLLSHAYLKRYE